jgi:hypothetical protein
MLVSYLHHFCCGSSPVYLLSNRAHFGLITVAFIPVGSYLLLVGISISAKNISQNAEIRKEFYKRAESQLNLLKAIGISEMERELMKQVSTIERRSRITPYTDEKIEDEQAQIILHEVLNELYYSKVKKRNGV